MGNFHAHFRHAKPQEHVVGRGIVRTVADSRRNNVLHQAPAEDHTTTSSDVVVSAGGVNVKTVPFAQGNGFVWVVTTQQVLQSGNATINTLIVTYT